MKGEKVAGYRKEKNVAPASPNDTFAAVKFYIDNWRWQDVPFYVRTGKRMHEKTTTITIQFQACTQFCLSAGSCRNLALQPAYHQHTTGDGYTLTLPGKTTGAIADTESGGYDFQLQRSYEGQEPEAYETLLLDVMEGNATLFMRADQVEAAWKIVMPILETWENRPPIDFPNYAPDSWGPEDAEALIARDGHNWITLSSANKSIK